MAARSRTPIQDPYGSVPAPQNPSHLSRGYGISAGEASHLGTNTGVTDFAPPMDTSPLSQSLQRDNAFGKFTEDFDASQRGSSVIDGGESHLHRSASTSSTLQHTGSVSRSGTLKKKGSLSRKSSLKRSGSRRSLRAGSIKGVSLDDTDFSDNHDSVFHTPIPTSGTPTDILANRFQAWRKFLKDLITYFREVQTSYEVRSKALLKVSNVINNTNAPSVFLVEGGLNEANKILRDYHKQSVVEANKARDIEIEVIGQLSGLRADLNSKIKEIKSLSGDFKNSVEKEKDGTKKAVAALEEALAAVDVDPSAVSGKGDPYVIRLSVERQVERQIDEENYLHRAYLNLEGSGRELESIVVGEIQKAYNALASILKRDADEAYTTVERLRNGPVALPKDHEWSEFVQHDPHFVNPNLALRKLEEIEYPGKHHPAAAEVRAGMLERKSKYLKSYTPGWYVLSPTHLHEFKSADRIYSQPPVMSLYLPEQKLGSHSQPGSSSHKFMLKGRQTGSMHRGHSWVFRAESYDTMMAWYEDIKILTEKTGEDRNAFVRRHVRSLSGGSARSISGSDLEEDEADEVPYSAHASMASQNVEAPQQRPSPGGRFPSDVKLDVNRHLQAPLSPSSGSSEVDHDLTTASGGLQNYGYSEPGQSGPQHALYHDPNATASITPQHQYQTAQTHGRPEEVFYDHAPQQNPQSYTLPAPHPAPAVAREFQQSYAEPQHPPTEQVAQDESTYPTTYGQVSSAHAPHLTSSSDGTQRNSSYGEWMAPVAASTTAGAVGARAYQANHPQEPLSTDQGNAIQSTAAADTTHHQPSHELPLNGSTSKQGPPAPISVSGPTSIATDGAVTSPLSTAGTDISSNPSTLASSVPNTPRTAAPVVKRQNTDMSVSDLHVPGEYPKRV